MTWKKDPPKGQTRQPMAANIITTSFCVHVTSLTYPNSTVAHNIRHPTVVIRMNTDKTAEEFLIFEKTP